MLTLRICTYSKPYSEPHITQMQQQVLEVFFIDLCSIYHVKYNILLCQASYKYPYATTSGLKCAYKYNVFVV